MEAVFLIGRILLSAIFVMSGLNHLMQSGPLSQYAASKGVPAPKLAVLGSGLISLAGGLSILLGYEPRVGAILLVLFLIPTAVIMHNFWAVQDPMHRQVEMAMFMKNVSIAGGALVIYYFTTMHPDAWVYSLGH